MYRVTSIEETSAYRFFLETGTETYIIESLLVDDGKYEIWIQNPNVGGKMWICTEEIGTKSAMIDIVRITNWSEAIDTYMETFM